MPTIALADGLHPTETYECDTTPDMNLNGDKYNVRPVDFPINKFWVPKNILTWDLPLQPMFYIGMQWCVYIVYEKLFPPTTTPQQQYRLHGKRRHQRRSPIPYLVLWLPL